MAYRRRQGIARTSTFKEEIYNSPYNSPPPPPSDDSSSTSSSSSSSQSLAAQAIRASAARRGSSFYSCHNKSSSDPLSLPQGRAYDYTSLRTRNDPAGSFWGVLARKAKSILDEENTSEQFAEPTQIPYNSSYYKNDPYYYPYQSLERSRTEDNPTIRKGLDRITSSINQIGGTIGNALEEGRSMVENKTADIIQETRKMQIRRKGTNPEEHIHATGVSNPLQETLRYSAQSWMQSDQQTQLKASRDVAMATAAKAKLLLRELKTVKADLAFAKQRCSQLEEENKILREAYEKGDHPADDDMIRLQLETLLAEKARLAHENSVFARENRFLREIVEYHQLTMQDVVYLDEGIEEVTEVYPVPAVSRMLSVSPPSPGSPTSAKSPLRSPAAAKESSHSPIRLHAKSSQSDATPAPASAPSQLQTQDVSSNTTPAPIQLQAVADVLENEAPPSSNSPLSSPTVTTGQPNSSA